MGSNPGTIYWMDIFSHKFFVKIYNVCLIKTENKRKWGRGWPIFLKKSRRIWTAAAVAQWICQVPKILRHGFDHQALHLFSLYLKRTETKKEAVIGPFYKCIQMAENYVRKNDHTREFEQKKIDFFERARCSFFRLIIIFRNVSKMSREE